MFDECPFRRVFFFFTPRAAAHSIGRRVPATETGRLPRE